MSEHAHGNPRLEQMVSASSEYDVLTVFNFRYRFVAKHSASVIESHEFAVNPKGGSDVFEQVLHDVHDVGFPA